MMSHLARLIIALLFLCVGRSEAQQLSTTASLCNMPLSPKVEIVYNQVKTLYGKDVICKFADLGHTWALFDIPPWGQPTIVLNVVKGRDESEILHELFHLKVRAEDKFRVTQYTSRPTTFNDVPAYADITYYIDELVEHSAFYPEMARLGFDPTEKIAASIRNSNMNNLPQGWAAGPDPQIAVHSAEAKIALNPEGINVLRAADKIIVANYGNAGLELGQKLSNLLKRFDLKTTDGRLRARIASFNLLFGAKAPEVWEIKDGTLFLGFPRD